MRTDIAFCLSLAPGHFSSNSCYLFMNAHIQKAHEDFIRGLIRKGRYANFSEVVRAGLRALEKDELELDLKKSSLNSPGQRGEPKKDTRQAATHESSRRPKGQPSVAKQAPGPLAGET